MRYNEKKVRKSIKRAQLLIFTPNFPKCKASGTLHYPKRHVFLKVLTKSIVFYFQKRALYVGTSCNKWLK